jgi:hypothetical protein
MNLDNLARLKKFYSDMTLETLKEFHRDRAYVRVEGRIIYTTLDCMATVCYILESDGDRRPSPREIAYGVDRTVIESFLDVPPLVAEKLFFMRDEHGNSLIPRFREEYDFEQQKYIILNCLGRLELHGGKGMLWNLDLQQHT